jgi:hypothetical protein
MTDPRNLVGCAVSVQYIQTLPASKQNFQHAFMTCHVKLYVCPSRSAAKLCIQHVSHCSLNLVRFQLGRC